MANRERKTTFLMEAFAFFDLLYFTIVREVRNESGGHPVFGILSAVSKILTMILVFYLAFELAGIKASPIRGDTMMYLLSGFLLFFLHNAGVSKVLSSNSITGGLQQHAPMTSILAISAAAFAALYLHVLAFGILLVILYLITGQVEIAQPAGIILPFLLAWASGVVIGLVLMALKPFAPKLVTTISTVYQRANMITSGKFFVANSLPAYAIPYFAWNPLFHSIDQMRGALFVNYTPHVTTIYYPLYFVLGGLVVGLMIEFWLRRTVSLSTGNR